MALLTLKNLAARVFGGRSTPAAESPAAAAEPAGLYATLRPMEREPGFMPGSSHHVYANDEVVLKVPKVFVRLQDNSPREVPLRASDVRAQAWPRGRAMLDLIERIRGDARFLERHGDVIGPLELSPMGFIRQERAGGVRLREVNKSRQAAASAEVESILESAREVLEPTGRAHWLDTNPANFRFDPTSGRVTSWFDPVVVRELDALPALPPRPNLP